VGISLNTTGYTKGKRVLTTAVLYCHIKLAALAIFTQSAVMEQFVVWADMLIVVTRYDNRDTCFATSI
jgi:hypothetical protein